MRQYTPTEQKINTISRAIMHFGYEYDENFGLEINFAEARSKIIEDDPFHRIDVSGKIQYEDTGMSFMWRDNKGGNFVYKSTVEDILTEHIETLPWYRYDKERNAFDEISVKEADRTTDFFFVEDTVDAEGKVVRLLAKLSSTYIVVGIDHSLDDYIELDGYSIGERFLKRIMLNECEKKFTRKEWKALLIIDEDIDEGSVDFVLDVIEEKVGFAER